MKDLIKNLKEKRTTFIGIGIGIAGVYLLTTKAISEETFLAIIGVAASWLGLSYKNTAQK